TGELAEIDLRIVFGRKVATVAASIDIDDVDAVDPIKIALVRKRCIRVDDAWVKARAKNGGNALALALLPARPLIIAVPGRRLAHLGRVFMNGRVDIGHTGIDARP